EVQNRLLDLRLGVHDERPVTHDGFVQWLATQKEQGRIFDGIKSEAIALSLKNSELRVFDGFSFRKAKLSVEYEGCDRPSCGDLELDFGPSLQSHVPDIHRAEGPG